MLWRCGYYCAYPLRPAQNYRYGGPERIPDAVVNEVLARLDAILG